MNAYDYPSDPINMLDLSGMCMGSINVPSWVCTGLTFKQLTRSASDLADSYTPKKSIIRPKPSYLERAVREIDHAYRGLLAVKSNVEAAVGLGFGFASIVAGLIKSPHSATVSAGLGKVSSLLGVAAIMDGCTAYRFEGLCRAELTTLFFFGGIAEVAASAGGLGGLPGLLVNGVYIWAGQSRGDVGYAWEYK